MNDQMLRGWAAIATYFGIKESTLREWRRRHAASDPLPIAQPGGTKGQVFASTAQLEAWLLRRAADGIAERERPAERVIVFRNSR